VHVPQPGNHEFARGVDDFGISGNSGLWSERSDSITSDYYGLAWKDVSGPDVDYRRVGRGKRSRYRRSCKRRGRKHQG